MSKYTVETNDLRTSARNLEDKNGQYVSAYRRLYTETDGLKATWKGQDNTKFNAQLESYRQRLELLSKIVLQYKDFLVKAATHYENETQAIADAASKLPGSI